MSDEIHSLITASCVKVFNADKTPRQHRDNNNGLTTMLKHAIPRLLLITGIILAGSSLSAHAGLFDSDSKQSKAKDSQWVGKPAPAFKLQDQAKKWHTLEQYRGKWLVIYFYPKDGTPGCTTEAKQFRDLYPQFQKNNTAVLGVSMDNADSHAKFSNDLGLPFPLLADTKHQLAGSFDVVRNLGISKIAKRESFLIDPKGIIVYHYVSINTDTHAQQVLDDILRLGKTSITQNMNKR
jgi:peroxiredoxin Q/BCP